jgi:hypothetical protein
VPGGWIEVLVDGELPAGEVGEFVGVDADCRQGATLLRGLVRDQADLVGMVARIEALPSRTTSGSPYGPWTIRARGRMRGEPASWLEGFAVSYDGGCTVLVGPVQQGAAAITDTLLHLQAVGLEVVDVRRKWLDDPDRRDQRP